MACPIEIQIPPIEEEIPNLDALPIAVVARHEAGHAIAACRCGGRAGRIVFGTTASGHPYGRAFWEIPPDDHKYLLVLSAGPVALFLHDRPSGRTFWDFLAWVATEDGYLRAISGASDWSEILRRTGQPKGYGIHDFLERAVQPYFEETCQLLANSRDQLDALTSLLLAHPPGLGPRALKRFFAGKPSSLWATRIDRIGVRWASAAEKRAADKA
ncbi:MAG: hypothetical protein ACREVO_14985 [Steroidobacteraceae bacterium]